MGGLVRQLSKINKDKEFNLNPNDYKFEFL